MATNYKKVGDNIRKLRKRAGLSQEDVSSKAKIDLTTVNEIEGGLRNPSLKTLRKISNA
jgi:transcriptional regulator with XRE-family HTH domain